MSKTPFASSKGALAFAAITILGTLIVVSPGGGGGMIEAAANRLAQKPRETVVVQAPAGSGEPIEEPSEPLDPASGWGGTAAPAFGDYEAETPPASEEPSDAPAARSSAPRVSPRGMPVGSEGLHIPVPRGVTPTEAPPPEPVVTARTMTIAPR
ncbi:MAG: hypothetical protein GC147_07175 [Porphyrobacter sp.]|nr:hypothetical protein [Porphyrobacter sp.]